MPDFHFSSSILLRYPLSEVFLFFSTAENLNLLTPPWVHFSILTPLPIEMRQGLVIQYRIRVQGIPHRWDSEITEWRPPFGFTDTQIRGPYRYWVHRHGFEETPEGTVCRRRHHLPRSRRRAGQPPVRGWGTAPDFRLPGRPGFWNSIPE